MKNISNILERGGELELERGPPPKFSRGAVQDGGEGREKSSGERGPDCSEDVVTFGSSPPINSPQQGGGSPHHHGAPKKGLSTSSSSNPLNNREGGRGQLPIYYNRVNNGIPSFCLSGVKSGAGGSSGAANRVFAGIRSPGFAAGAGLAYY